MSTSLSKKIGRTKAAKIDITGGVTLLAFVPRSKVCGSHPSLNSSGDGHVVEHLERLI